MSVQILKTFEKFRQKINNNGIILTTNYEEFEEKYLKAKLENKQTNKIRVNCLLKCGHEVNVNIASIMYIRTDKITKNKTIEICSECLVYNRYKELFFTQNCELITSYEEFLSEGKKFKNFEQMIIKYKATCGHENLIGIKSFKECYGRLCKECMIAKQHNKTIEDTNGMEDKCIQIFVNKIKHYFDTKLTDDGCLADLAIKNINDKKDKWLMIQIKTTNNNNDNKYSYTFGKTDKYKNCIIICTCINNDKLWIFDGNDVNTKTISISKSKKHTNEVDINQLCEKIISYIKIIPLYSFDEINIPISKSTQIEQIYRKHREEKCYYLNFIYPDETNLRYDFKINEYKIQEKVATVNSKISVTFTISKTTGNNIKTPYEKGDNDFYWIHFPCKQKFLILPEQVLIDDNYIKSDKTIGRKAIYINTDKIQQLGHKWNRYLFDYNNNDKTLLTTLFKPLDKT